MTTDLATKFRNFNRMYGLPLPDRPTTTELGETVVKRLEGFKKTLVEEVNEIDEIDTDSEIDCLVSLADLLGDICVYCNTEAAKFGIPLVEVLDIIMESNESKLAADGSTIYNEDGKVMKGPNYWAPEAKIKELILTRKENSSLRAL